MKKFVITCLALLLMASSALPAKSEISTRVKVDDDLFVVYSFENLNQTVYEQALTQFKAETIPQIIVKNSESANQTVQWSFASQPIVFDNDTRTIETSFFLSGSAIISSAVNQTTLRRMYQAKTDWRKFRLNLASSYSIDFAETLATPVSEWQKLNSTSFYYENKQTGTLDTRFYLVMPASALDVRAQGDVVSYELPPSLEEWLLDSPFLILGALIVALIIILIYRRVR